MTSQAPAARQNLGKLLSLFIMTLNPYLDFMLPAAKPWSVTSSVHLERSITSHSYLQGTL